MALKIYLNQSTQYGKRYSIVDGNELYVLETGKKFFNMKKVATIGTGYIPSGRLIRNPDKKLLYIIQGVKKKLGKK